MLNRDQQHPVEMVPLNGINVPRMEGVWSGGFMMPEHVRSATMMMPMGDFGQGQMSAMAFMNGSPPGAHQSPSHLENHHQRFYMPPQRSPGSPPSVHTSNGTSSTTATAYVTRMPVSDDKNDDSGVSMKSPGDGSTNSDRSSPHSETMHISPSHSPRTSRDSSPELQIHTSIASYNLNNNINKVEDEDEDDEDGQFSKSETDSRPGANKQQPRKLVGLRPDPYKCPRCDPIFSTQSKMEFAEHIASHVSDNPDVDYFTVVKNLLFQLTMKGTVGTPEELALVSPSSGFKQDSDAGVNIPRVNNQGRVKIMKCRACPSQFITKAEYWQHSKDQHLNEKKILKCPSCNFVSEYKHHLEYHLRNHAGSKPFKCDQCNYECVNKSMLNSHMKSHSSIYQFPCADCGYATKYLHSLKLHLRKYKHVPGTVLGLDGKPAPNAIVDVHGTRRGPKSKTKVKKDTKQQLSVGNPGMPMMSNVYPNMQSFVPAQQITAPSQFAFNPIPNGVPQQFNGYFPFAMPNGLSMPMPNTMPQQFPSLTTPNAEQLASIYNNQLIKGMISRAIQETQQDWSSQQNNNVTHNNEPEAPLKRETSVSPTSIKHEPIEELEEEEEEKEHEEELVHDQNYDLSDDAPLDLSKPDINATLDLSVKVESPQNLIVAHKTASSSRRRKGLAPSKVDVHLHDVNHEYKPTPSLSPASISTTPDQDGLSCSSPTMQEPSQESRQEAISPKVIKPKRRHSFGC